MKLEEALRLHHELWMEISRLMNPEFLTEEFLKSGIYTVELSTKEKALENMGWTDVMPENGCFLCQYTVHTIFDDCSTNCPVRWNGARCVAGEFGDWCNALRNHDIDKAKEMAIIIANLPPKSVGEISYHIECFDRYLRICVDDENRERALEIIDAEYTNWCDVETNPDLQFECCEEYILRKLTEDGIAYVEMEDE